MNHLRRRLDHACRVATTGLSFGIFGAACVGVGLVVFPVIRLTAPDADAARRRVRWCIHRAYRFFIRLWRALGIISYELHDGERLRPPGQLIVANHPTLIDVLFVGAQVAQVNCIVKGSLLRHPVLGAPARWAGYIPNGAPEHLIDNCVATLRAGASLLVFPEGTRSVPGQALRLQRGAAHVALAAGADLLPVIIRCEPSALTKADVWYRVPTRRPHWSVSVGEPIRLADLVVPGESRARAARRVTDHLADYFSTRAGLPAGPEPVSAR